MNNFIYVPYGTLGTNGHVKAIQADILVSVKVVRRIECNVQIQIFFILRTNVLE